MFLEKPWYRSTFQFLSFAYILFIIVLIGEKVSLSEGQKAEIRIYQFLFN